ncbi:MAG: hypothetical protein IMZ69_02390 [Spirochaetes bacterium]|nr:hypothetical protein [Spirochaetota bacterium]
MAISTLDGYIGAAKYRLTWMKTGTRTLIAAMPYTVFDLAGSPGAGVLNVGNTANGLVPTDAVAGYPAIPSFAGQTGYLARVEFGSSVPCCFDVFDRLFVAGAYAIGADVTLASQPSFDARLPNAGIYNGLQLWVEAVTAYTGVLNIEVNYLDQDGAAGDTGVVATLALPIGRCYQIPLAAGDSGISKIVRVRVTVATVGTCNVMILRPLWFGRVITANGGDVHDILRTGFPKIFDTSALYTLLYADATAVGLPDLTFQVAVG